MTASLISPTAAGDPTVAWSRRVRRVGGFIQLAFATFWLARGGLSVHGGTGVGLAALFGVMAAVALGYGVWATAGTGSRPAGLEAKRIERAVTVATVIQLIASFAAPAAVIAAGHSDWVLPSIAITIGPLLLWLNRRVHIPRYRLAGWVLMIGPIFLVAITSGTALAAATGIAAGFLLLSTATAGFHDLAIDRAASA